MYRIYINSRSAADALQYSAPAFTPGAICVTALRWLSELRSRLIKEGPAVFKSRVSLSFQRSRQSQQQNSAGSSAISLPSSRMGSQQFSLGSSAIDNMQPGGGGIVHVSMSGISSSAYEALSALLAGSSSPFKVQMLEGALIIEAPSQALIQWLNSQEAAELLYLAQSNFFKKMNQEVLTREDASVAGRCCEAYGAVRRVEDGHMLDISKYNSSVLQQRSQVVSMALKYTSAFGFSQDAMYDGLQLFDKAICNSSGLNPALWPLVLCSCTLLAAKSNALERNNQHWPSAHHISMTSGFSIEAISTMEQNVLAALQQDLSCISVLRVVQLCLERLGYYMQGEDGSIKLSGCTAATMYSLLAKVACSPWVLGIRPSLVAAATVVVMRRVQGSVPHWPTALQLMTSYTLSTNSDLQMVVMHVESLLLSQT
ncbi:hypothetical protein CEUSTIGMA_g11448.t1 [Chlamydomonas eustigma]|uniref:Uncharacterized protein n=1 Tax=Chlamydomonas eustigma TaxID=1157962 RepID=A0A250XLW5_9CHLO|nr:hypothetical protein CEUSTIGMA_g11448.t1 [Chlamydomonas eustigma]|eukprot:GAX84023.1 hypothetical protein CEUSTIGMA_g11448.t1 [Chlamydomonas eustigma]